MRADREDLSQQHEALRAARVDLCTALGGLEEAADVAGRALARKRHPTVTDVMVDVHTWRVAVERAEQAVHIAEDDLEAAAGRTG